MTKTIAIFLGTLFIFNNIYSQKQSLETKYISGEKSRHCIKELYKFSFEGKWYSKYDSYDGSKKYGYSKISQTDYDKRGHYEMVEKVGLYWHFVDLVWVFVFTFFYLV